MLSVTVGLGVWQVQRLQWKRALLAEIDMGEASPASALHGTPTPFRRVFVTGHFVPGEARYGVDLRADGTRGPVIGSQRLAAFMPTEGSPLVVDRGWAPDDAAAPLPSGDLRIEGYVRPPDHASWFTPSPDPTTRRFFALDPAPIATSLGLADAAPFTLVLLGDGRGTPATATSLPRPPNNHFSYAVTWFGLSAALVIVFGLYVKQVLTETEAQ